MHKVLLAAIVLFFAVNMNAQTYAPIPVAGFTQDIFAESGTNALAVTSVFIDGTNHIMHTENFAAANGITGGVLNSGTIVSGTRSYQLAPYTGNNALYLSLNGAVAGTSASSTLTLQTPARYSNISFLSFSTEGSSTLNALLTFTDGTVYNAGNFLFQDWFGGPNAVYAAFGRITRLAAGPYPVDGLPTNPRWYAADIVVSCAIQNKLLQSITISYISQSGSSGRGVALAVSGVPFTQPATAATVIPATCGVANGSIALTSTGGTPPLSYVWNTTPPQFAATATSLPAGTYTATISDANGCISTYTDTVKQTGAIIATATANPAAICSSDSVTLTATSTGGNNNTYTWSPGGQTSPVIKVSPADTTTYTVTISDGTGCSTIATVTVAVKKEPVAAIIASPKRFCLRNTDTVRFTGTAGSTATYNWDFDNANVISGTGAGPYVLQFPTAGNHTIKLIVTENGCSSSEATDTILVDGASQPAFTITPAAICSGDTVQVNFTGTAFAGATPAWNWGSGTVISGSGLGPYTVKYNATGIIRLSISNATCTDTAAAQAVTVTLLPIASFSFVKTGCAPADISFTNNSQNGTTYLWNFGDGTTSTSQLPPAHRYDTAGNYTVTLTVANGNCTATAPSQIIRLSNFPVANFTSMPDVSATPLQLSQAQFSFTNTSVGATAYKWFFGDGDSSSQANPTHRFRTPGSFRVILFVSNADACVDSISVSPYIIIADSALRIPNAFSPNNDGTNDHWQIPGLLGYPNCRVEVFDRYGQIVFTSTGYNNPWDGKRNGRDLPVATYYYVIRTSLKNYTGWVLLVR